MSRVTNIILTTAASREESAIGKLNEWIGRDYQLLFVPVDSAPETCAGDKHLECEVYVGAFNHLDLSGFIKVLESCNWEFPEYVQLFVKEDNDSRFRQVGLWERES